MDSFIARVLETIDRRKLINAGDTVVVGLSGGPDSVCLLHVLHSISPEMNLNIHAVHVNHMLRGPEADGDELYVRQLCGRLGVELSVFRENVRELAGRKGISLEEAGREARYRLFGDTADRVGARRVAVAHNKNDQAETVLMNLMRGSGLDGLAGMDYLSGRIIRPLLDIERYRIEEYCRMNALNPRTDSSNLESIYTRNKVRLGLIPFMDREFGLDAVGAVARLAGLLRDDRDFLEKCTEDCFRSCVADSGEHRVVLSLSKLNGLHAAMMKRVVREALKRAAGSLKGVESVHTDDIIKLAEGGRTGSRLCLPRGIVVGRSYDSLVVSAGDDMPEIPFFDVPAVLPGVTRVDALNGVLTAKLTKKLKNVEHYRDMGYNSLKQFFDYEKLEQGINIRNRRDGDVFRPAGSRGTKKLKKYLIDKKIPRDVRDMMPLVAAGSQIVWIIGDKTSDKFKVTENTNLILELEYEGRLDWIGRLTGV